MRVSRGAWTELCCCLRKIMPGLSNERHSRFRCPKSLSSRQEGDDAPNPRITSRYWFTLSTTREERFFLVLAVFIGVFSALAVVCFRLAIDWSKIWLLGPVPEPHNWRLIAVPALTESGGGFSGDSCFSVGSR